MTTENSDNKTLTILTHVLGLFTWFIGPLIVLLVSKDEEIKKHAKNALNWEISFLIYLVISSILMVVLIGFLLAGVLVVLNIVFCIMAAVKAKEGMLWKYPLTIPFLKV